MKVYLAALLILPAASQTRFAGFDRDLRAAAAELHISDLRVTVVESGRVVWQKTRITARAPEEPVIAQRIPRRLLDTSAPVPPGATIRQVLENRADGTPGEEVLENRGFFEALHTSGPTPSAVSFVKEDHGTLGWFLQNVAGQIVLWNYDPSLLMVKIPSKKLALVVWANSKSLTEAARLTDGNILRSTIALAFLRDAAGLTISGENDFIDRALVSLYQHDTEASAAMVRQAVDKFPGLESTPDVTLLYLFAHLLLPETQDSATAVIRDHPSLPTAWFYYGQYLENSKRYREAAACFEKITMHQPPWHHWTVAAAKQELSSLQ